MSANEGKLKALNSTDKRALSKLVDNDFAIVEVELRQFADEVLAQRLDEARRSKGKLVERAEARKARGKVTFEGYNFRTLRASISVHVDGLDAAERQVREETQRELDKALTLLKRRKLAAQRQVLMAGVSDEAKALLDAIPAAADLMGEARSRRAVTA